LSNLLKIIAVPDMMVHVCNPNTFEAEVGGLQVEGQPGLHSNTMSQNLPSQKIIVATRKCIYVEGNLKMS
jgi:hypothetical protein